MNRRRLWSLYGITGSASTCAMQTSSLAYSSASIGRRNLKGQVLAWPMSDASSTATEDGLGRRVLWMVAQHSTFRCQHFRKENNHGRAKAHSTCRGQRQGCGAYASGIGGETPCQQGGCGPRRGGGIELSLPPGTLSGPRRQQPNCCAAGH